MNILFVFIPGSLIIFFVLLVYSMIKKNIYFSFSLLVPVFYTPTNTTYYVQCVAVHTVCSFYLSVLYSVFLFSQLMSKFFGCHLFSLPDVFCKIYEKAANHVYHCFYMKIIYKLRIIIVNKV